MERDTVRNTVLIEMREGFVAGVFADKTDLVDIVIMDHDLMDHDVKGSGGEDPRIEFSYARPMASADKETLEAVAKGRSKTLMMTVRLKWERGLWRRECRRQQKWANAFALSIFFLLFALCVLLSMLFTGI